MTITLDSVGLPVSRPIALPCFRICALIDGGFGQDGNAAAALAVHDVFMQAFAADLRFCLIQSRSSKSAKVVKATAARLAELREALAGNTKGGFEALRGIRLYGTDENALGAPFLPFLSIGRSASFDLLQIELSVPHDMPGLAAFVEAVHGILVNCPVRFGVEGFGFDKSGANGLQDRYLPLAYKRFRTALLGDFDKGFAFILFDRPALRPRWGEIALGIADMGWRTWVHADYAGALGKRDTAEKAGVRVEDHGSFLTVTAGPAPLWGDLNAGEDVGPFTAAFDFLRPAFGDMRFIMGALWGGNRPEERDASQGYVNRLSKGALG